MEQVKSKKKGIIIAGISAIVLIAVLGISFAIWNYSRTTDNQILVAGDIYMKFKESPALTIENAIPSEGPGEKYFEFTIEGENTYNKPIWYEIDLQYGEDHETRKTRIKDSLLKFRLVEIKDGDEQIVVDNASYSDLTNKKIWVNTIPANTKDNIEITYRLYMWISSETIIGNTSDAIYDMETWNNDVFASIKVNVTGDLNKKKLEKEIKYGIGTEALKSIAVSNITDTCTEPGYTGELVAINTAGKLYQEDSGQEIREYRYVGPDVDNYIYFNCQDGKEQNGDNCEIWRILGIFKDGSGAEHIRIVRNNVLTRDMFPVTFEANGAAYNIQSTNSSGDYAYWNYMEGLGLGAEKNDWATGGLQYWLNAGSDKETSQPSDGYMSYLSKNAKNMIENTKYYLGNFNYQKNTITNYTYERGNASCSGSCSGGDIWVGNHATWNGNIALMYPSDIKYAESSCSWTIALNYYDPNVNENWLYKTANHDNDEWLLSPFYYNSHYAASWSSSGTYVRGERVDYVKAGVRPSINLISGATIVAGDGTVDRPYQLNSGQ